MGWSATLRRARSEASLRLRQKGVLHPHGFTALQAEQLSGLLNPIADRLGAIEAKLAGADFDILDAYCDEVPSAQTAIDLFDGEWAARFPAPLEHLRAGQAPLFAAEHVPWGVSALGGVEGQRVVELGPLEGGHTYMLDRLGAAEVVAIEANTRAYLKCLISKELLGIPSGRFLCGDAVRYLQDHLAHGRAKFDLCLASGVLYHLRNPVAALDLMTRVSDRLLLWTMYYDHDFIQSRDELRVKFSESTSMEYAGYRHTLYRQEYQQALAYKGFCGGSAATSAWMTKSDIFGALEHFGFDVLEVGFEEQNHKGNGPCIALVAQRRAG